MNILKPTTSSIICTLFLSTASMQSFALANNQLNNQLNNQKDKSTCEIIIDAGSSGSRLHLFKLTSSTNISTNISNKIKNKTLPDTIEDLTEDNHIKTSPGISSYVDNPAKAGASIKDLLDKVIYSLDDHPITKECNQDLSQIPVYLNATAGMRLVPKKQQKKIYKAIKNSLSSSYNWKAGSIKTIPGWQEGLFDWLSLNYENIKNGKATSGALDLGGASTQLAFDTKNMPSSDLTSKTKDDKKVIKLKLNNKKYKIFSISFLGLGQDQARGRILKASPDSFYYCYPEDAIFNEPKSTNGVTPAPSDYNIISKGKFRPMNCRWAAKIVLNQKGVYSKVNKLLTPELTSRHNDKKFMAFAGFYYASDFFDKSKNLKELSNSIKEKCKDNWDDFQKSNQVTPAIPTKYFINECINASYALELLHYGYKFPINNSDKIQFISDADWTKGAALYYFLKKQLTLRTSINSCKKTRYPNHKK